MKPHVRISQRKAWFVIAIAMTNLATMLEPAAAQSSGQKHTYDWRIPAWLPPPPVPDDNPMSDEKTELGRHLFYDKRLSRDGSMSCATCHIQALAFTDGRPQGVGFDGTQGNRNSMGLTNAGYLPVLTWGNPNLRTLETHALVPLFGDNPVEMGMAGREQELFERLAADADYPARFRAAFPERNGEISLATLTRALAAFQRTLISAGSPYDRYKYGGDEKAISKAAKRGEDLFFSHRLECYHCHSGFNFTNNLRHSRSSFAEFGFHNNGLYNVGGRGVYPAADIGLGEFTGKSEDNGKFRTPSLRNVTRTAPYMHDGSIKTIGEVIDHYSEGGRTIKHGVNAGNGSKNPNRDPLIVASRLTPREKKDLIAFLESLTDEAFLANPRFANPWRQGPNADPADRTQKFYR
jgi:cytochrome c peroxidase